MDDQYLELTHYEQSLLYLLIDLQNQGDSMELSHGFLANGLKVCINTIIRAQQGLENKGFIKVTRRYDPRNPKVRLFNSFKVLKNFTTLGPNRPYPRASQSLGVGSNRASVLKNKVKATESVIVDTWKTEDDAGHSLLWGDDWADYMERITGRSNRFLEIDEIAERIWLSGRLTLTPEIILRDIRPFFTGGKNGGRIKHWSKLARDLKENFRICKQKYAEGVMCASDICIPDNEVTNE